MPTMHPHLMFEGRAEEAIDFYVSLFPDGERLDDGVCRVEGAHATARRRGHRLGRALRRSILRPGLFIAARREGQTQTQHTHRSHRAARLRAPAMDAGGKEPRVISRTSSRHQNCSAAAHHADRDHLE